MSRAPGAWPACGLWRPRVRRRRVALVRRVVDEQRPSRAVARATVRFPRRPRCPQNALATTLRNAFSATANHRLPRELIAQSKKWGALAVVCVLFRMYFKLNQLRQSKFLIAAVEGPGFPPLDQFPRAQVRGAAGRAAGGSGAS